jgi:hypothetical protein
MVVWKDIPIFDGLYKISSNGEVLSVRYNKILKPTSSKKGYHVVDLRNNGKRRGMFIHRLVMLSFIGESKLEVNHKNGVKTDNRLENLEYVTTKENIRHGWKLGLYKKKCGEDSHSSILTEAQVIEIKKLLLIGYTHKELGIKFNVNYSTIGKISLGKTWKHIKV